MISDRERQALECIELAAQADDPVVQKSLLQAAEALRIHSAPDAAVASQTGTFTHTAKID